MPEKLTEEALLKPHKSYPRNRAIAEAFYRAGFIESWGRGISKITEGFKNAGLPEPKIENHGGGVMIMYSRSVVDNGGKWIVRIEQLENNN